MINELILLDKDSVQVLKVRDFTIEKGGQLIGKAVNIDFPEKLKQLFQEHEERVNQNILSELDRLEEEIQSYGLHLMFKNRVYPLLDIQLMNEDDISFKFANEVPAELKI